MLNKKTVVKKAKLNKKINKLVLLRHGESQWNQENRFTGWTDIDLSAQGVTEAIQAAQLLQAHHFTFDSAFTSVLTRAIRTLWILLEQMDLRWLPVEKTWKLNERHYGALQGLNKSETAQQYGAEQVQQWRRSFSVAPPALTLDDARFPGHDRRYKYLLPKQLPKAESLAMTIKRVVPYWQQVIRSCVAGGESVLVVAHGNSLRALAYYLDNMSESAILDLNIPTGVPLIYEFDDHMKPLRHYYLGDQAAIAAKQQAVANQTVAR